MFEEFKEEHTSIIDGLINLRKLGSRTRERQQELLSTKNKIFAHIKNEDEHFYPALKKRAESNCRLRDTLNAFIEDRVALSEYTHGFFESMSTEEGTDFALALEDFIAVHTTRIKREEAVLYTK